MVTWTNLSTGFQGADPHDEFSGIAGVSVGLQLQVCHTCKQSHRHMHTHTPTHKRIPVAMPMVDIDSVSLWIFPLCRWFPQFTGIYCSQDCMYPNSRQQRDCVYLFLQTQPYTQV